MKKILLLTLLCAVFVFGRTGFGNTYISRIDMHSNGEIYLVTTTRPGGVSAFKFTDGHRMGKIWLASLLTAQSNKRPIYVYYHENTSAKTPTLDKVEIK